MTHYTASLQYGDGLPRDPMFILLSGLSSERMISGARRISGQNGKAREDANEFDASIASHCDSLMLFVMSLKSGTNLHEIRAGMLIGIQ
jgi:hypothetical protein